MGFGKFVKSGSNNYVDLFDIIWINGGRMTSTGTNSEDALARYRLLNLSIVVNFHHQHSLHNVPGVSKLFGHL